jgi:hypothetical protein
LNSNDFVKERLFNQKRGGYFEYAFS